MRQPASGNPSSTAVDREWTFKMTADTQFYLDDFQVGQRFTTASHQLTAEAIIKFASEFDPQPFHTDPEAAKDTFFGSLVASGWHTAAVSMRLMVQTGIPIAGGWIGAGGTIEWPRPVHPGDTLRVEIEVTEVRVSKSRPNRGMVAIRGTTRNQRGETVEVVTAKLIVFRRLPTANR